MTTETYIEMAARQRAELLRMARDFLHDEAEAEDAVQESLLRLWLMRERIAQPRDFCLLAVRITKNVCISLWRKHQGRQMLPLEALTSLESSMRCDGVEEAENSRLLREAVDSLPPSYRRIFHLWRQGMEIQEIAIVAGAKPRTVSSMLSAARARILARLKQIS
ncbi:MAG: RNA polymerase sigma factor [Bacteroidaceae bacterium]